MKGGMRILVTGGTGQVGFELQRQLCLLGEIQAPSRKELDLADSAGVDRWLQHYQPGLIVNAAAYTAVDKAESEPGLAQRLNAELPAQLAAYCASREASLVHYSSDYVYPGTGDAPWQEDSATGPLSRYGQTKLEGDQAIAASGCSYLVLRTSWVYSAHGNNFMKTMLRLAKNKTELNIVADQIGAPTPARLIAQVTTLAIHSQLTKGLYHLAPRGETSWLGFAREIFKRAAEAGKELTLKPENARPIPTSAYPAPAPRPLNSRMDVSKLEQALNIQLPDWQSQLAVTLVEYLEKK